MGKLGHLVVMTAPFDEERAKVRYVLADGIKFDMEKSQPASKGAAGKGGFGKGRGGAPGTGKDIARKDVADDEPDAHEKAEEKKEGEAKEEPAGKEARKGQSSKKAEVAKKKEEARKKDEPLRPFVDVASELEADRKPAIKTGGNVLIKDAVILTVTKGTIPKGSILVKDGKIAAIGPDVKAPEGVKVIEANGLVAMPGIIDTHSHMAISGGVNEMSLSIVPEVRVKDVSTRGDVSKASTAPRPAGRPSAHLLHGSANTIGGQDAVMKLEARKGRGRETILNAGARRE